MAFENNLLHVGFVGDAGVSGTLWQVLDPLNGDSQLFRNVIVVDAVINSAQMIFWKTLKSKRMK